MLPPLPSQAAAAKGGALPLKLVILAVVVAIPLLLYLTTSAGHDPYWYKAAGISEKSPHVDQHLLNAEKKVRLGEINREAMDASRRDTATVAPVTDAKVQPPIVLENGTHFFADYDVNAIVEPSMIYGDKPAFRYPEHGKTAYPFKTVSTIPRILYVPDFLTDAECDAIIEEANKTLHRSTVTAGNAKDTRVDGNGVSDVRTSSQTWFNLDNPLVTGIVQRLKDFSGIAQCEAFQVLRYDFGQQYIAHTDYFPTKMFGPQASNRAATAFLYFTDVEEGGETQFPRADSKPMNWDFRSCRYGLRVKPKKRLLVIFYDMLPDGRFDAHSLHGGCPPKKGTKWGGTLWLRVPTPLTEIAEFGV